MLYFFFDRVYNNIIVSSNWLISSWSHNKIIELTNGAATFTPTLIKGRNYKIAFWAFYNDNNSPAYNVYDKSSSLRCYNGLLSPQAFRNKKQAERDYFFCALRYVRVLRRSAEQYNVDRRGHVASSRRLRRWTANQIRQI